MRVFVAGATGVIGSRLVPLLLSVGHDVVGLARSDGERTARLREAGAKVVIGDALDRSGMARVVRDAAPDAIVNMLTAIPAEVNPRRMSRDFELTNQLRTVGTRNLVDAAARTSASQFISQGLAYAYDPGGDEPANEDEPFWRNPPKDFVPLLQSLRELERLTAGANGLVLRFGHLYGPGSHFAENGSFVRQVRAGKLPLVGAGTAIFSFTHAQDAATAIVAALDKTATGALNVVDDDPAPMHEWLPFLARMLGAPAPKGAPAVLARLAVGGWGVAFMTQLRGADNARARLTLDWRSQYHSWRDGFAAELGHQSNVTA